MHMRKKNLIIATVACTVLLALAGCGNETGTPKTRKEETKQEQGNGALESKAPETSKPTDKSSKETVKPTEESGKTEEPEVTEASQIQTTPDSQKPDEERKNEKSVTEPQKNVIPESPAMEVSVPEETIQQPVTQENNPQITTENVSIPEVPQLTQNVPTEAVPTVTPKPTEPTTGFTQEDHTRIIAEVKQYAESYASKGFQYEWKEAMEFGNDVGYMGTPRISRDGVDGVIETLKYHVDLIYQTSTNPDYGVVTDYMTYKVVQITIDGETAYAVIYGG